MLIRGDCGSEEHTAKLNCGNAKYFKATGITIQLCTNARTHCSCCVAVGDTETAVISSFIRSSTVRYIQPHPPKKKSSFSFACVFPAEIKTLQNVLETALRRESKNG